VRLYIKRREEDAVRAIGNWTLIYGRRKTGKTTLVKRNLRMDLYILIADPGNAITLDDRVVKVDEAMRAVRRMSKVAERVGLVGLRERPGDYGDLSLGPRELLDIARRVSRGESMQGNAP
jgi:AAA+ ATPase superfamily predicted ATPase